MRVLFISRDIDRPHTYLLQQLREAGVEISCFSKPNAVSTKELKSSGLQVNTLALKHRLHLPSILAVRRELKLNPVDIIHAIDSKSLSISLWASFDLSPAIVAYRGTERALSRIDPSCRMAHLNRRVSKVTCVSDAVRRSLLSVLPEDKLMTIYKGHNTDWYQNKRVVSFKQFGIPEDATVIVCVANDRPCKGGKVLLEAMHLIKDEKIHLLFVGHTKSNGFVKQAAGPAQSRIHFAGFRQDAVSLSGRADIFVMPSLRDGLPRALIEAMAQGVAVVASETGGIPELISNQEEGLIVKPGDPEKLAQAITFLANNAEKRCEFGKRAKERIENDFSADKMVAETLELYRSILGKGN